MTLYLDEEVIVLTSLFLTKTGGILGPIAEIMGVIMDALFKFTQNFGVVNIGLCIILFTLVTRIIMFPLSYRQARSQKLMSIVQPEVMAIQKKYSGKTDQQSMMMQNAEIKAVYDKYGTSMTGGCLQLVIQMPIILALYQVILNIPAYVPSVKQYFTNIVGAIGGEGSISAVKSFIEANGLENLVNQARISGGVSGIATSDHIIDFLYRLNPAQWDLFTENFNLAGNAVVADSINNIINMNNFFGINLATAPGAGGLANPNIAWLIPILAGLSQWFSTKLMQSQQNNSLQGDENPMANTMKTMNIMFPLMSVWFCFTFASGIGVYWIASSFIMGIQQYLLNAHFSKMDIDAMIKQNIEKTNAKRAKKGLPPINEKTAENQYKKLQQKEQRDEERRQAALEKTKERVEESNKYYNTGSISERAKMVQRYNEKHNK